MTIHSMMPQNMILGDVISKPAETKEALKEQTDNFEAILLKQMLDIAMPEESDLFGKSVGSEIYRSMYHEELSKSVSGGFGYSELLYDFLSESLQENQKEPM